VKSRVVVLLLLVLNITSAWADENVNARINRLEQQLLIRDKLIRNLLDRVNALEDKLDQTNKSLSSDATKNSDVAPTTTPIVSKSTTPAATTPPATDSLAQLRASAAFERTLIQRGGLLLAPYIWEIEPSVSYSHSSSDHVVIDGFTVAQVLVVGDIFNQRIDRDIVQAALTLRMGLPADSQFELRVPYAHVEEKVYNVDGKETSSSTNALGDIELAYSHQFSRGSQSDVSWLASLRWKTTTGQDPFALPQNTASIGSGYNSLQLTTTAIMPSDPVVFFGGLSYTANLPVNKSVGRVDPGDSYGFQAGIALSLNMDTSLSIGWEQRYTQKTKVNDQPIAGSYLNSGNLTFSVSHTMLSGRSYDVSANIGLTRDSPDAMFSIAVPFSP